MYQSVWFNLLQSPTAVVLIMSKYISSVFFSLSYPMFKTPEAVSVRSTHVECFVRPKKGGKYEVGQEME